MTSKITWTDQTWNPIIGCSKTSPGCANCYAEKMAFRQTRMRPGCEYCSVIGDDGRWNGKTEFVKSALEKPLHWRKPRMIFVCSMSDLFHESVPLIWIDKVFNVIAKCPQHTFQILTKRASRMAQYFAFSMHGDLKNVWLGVTAEDQQRADERIPHLLNCPAVRFVSIEPMLGPVNLDGPKADDLHVMGCEDSDCPCGQPKLDWVICGGESGSEARPLEYDWVRDLRDICMQSGTLFLFKQWGSKSLGYASEQWGYDKNHPKGGNSLDGWIFEEFPEGSK